MNEPSKPNKHMKLKAYLTAALLLTLPFLTVSCGDDHHDHADHKEHHDEDVHDESVNAGPNGGHVIKSESGHALEVLVNDDRKACIRLLDKDGKVTELGNLAIQGIAGPRSSPTKLSFASQQIDGDGVLVSDNALPAGAHVPMILTVKLNEETMEEILRFELHLH